MDAGPAKAHSTRRQLPPTLRIIGKGALMGAADIVPGISGGTVAFVLGIYPRLVAAISSIDSALLRAAWQALLSGSGRAAFKVHWRRVDGAFLIWLATGILAAIVVASRLLVALIEAQPTIVLAVFFGLVVASAWLPVRAIRSYQVPTGGTPVLGLALVTGAGVGFVLSGGTPASVEPRSWAYGPVGAIAICAMILPGISGAFLLLLLGYYEPLLNAVRSWDLAPLLLFMTGAAFGILAFSRLLRCLLGRHGATTMAALTGLMLGSLRKLWPFKDDHSGGLGTGANVWPAADLTTSLAVAAAAAALGLVLAIELRRARRTD